MGSRQLCIHGHFYQPPREDPWLDIVCPEGSAAPARNWNERIARECYAPLAVARRQDDQGRIFELVNCYEWISFNFGPTLLNWMEHFDPATYGRILAADAASVARLGHGNAMAQIFHHVIMPLATDRDRRAEAAWAVADFKARFKRDPEGMWLSEAAVDDRTLEILADLGIRFTILAPRQAESMQDQNGQWRAVSEWEVNIREPYLVELSGGRSIAVFFYNGPLSQAVAFEGLLRDGEQFWHRLSEAAGEGLASIATDGETYGHHFSFGEMALAYVLAQGRENRDGIRLTNYAAYLAENPPQRKVRIRQSSSWSCVHGVERWRSDCGCTTGGHPDWNQRWRKPLRDALDGVKAEMDAHYDSRGGGIFKDPDHAMTAYGEVMSGLCSPAEFAKRHFKARLDEAGKDAGWKLLSMQKWALAAYASCAWFFDDLGRIEPMNSMTYALRAMDLARRTGCADLEPHYLAQLGQGASNDPALGSGTDIWNRDVRPRRETPESLVSQAAYTLWAEGRLPAKGQKETAAWPGVSISVASLNDPASPQYKGEAVVAWRHEPVADRYSFVWEKSQSDDPMSGCIEIRSGNGAARKCVPGLYLPWEKRQDIALAWITHAENGIWQEEVRLAATAVHLFNSYREAQTTQTGAPSWQRLWAPLAWSWIMGFVPGRPELVAFLKDVGVGHADAGMLAERVGAALAGLLGAEQPDWRAVGSVLRRCLAVDVLPDLWQPQNRYFELRKAGQGNAEVARLLWIEETGA